MSGARSPFRMQHKLQGEVESIRGVLKRNELRPEARTRLVRKIGTLLKELAAARR